MTPTSADIEARRARLHELGIDVVEADGVCTVVRRHRGELVSHVSHSDPATAREQAVAKAERHLRLDPIDSALADTFPASDPPSAGQASL